MANPITPEQLAKSGSEDAHQAALFCWAINHANEIAKSAPNSFVIQALRLMFAIPNGGSRHKAEAAKLVMTGTKSGVPDIFLAYPIKQDANERNPFYWHGLFIEMKKPGLQGHKNGGCSDNQIEWHENLRHVGYKVVVCYTWQEARDAILTYLRGGE